MAAASSPLSSSLSSSSSSLSHVISNPRLPSPRFAFSISIRSPLPSRLPSFSSLRLRLPRLPPLPPLPSLSNGSGNNGDKSNGRGNNLGGGGGGDGDDDEEESGWEENRNEALFVLANLGRSLDSLPLDLAEAIRDGKVTGEIVTRFVNLEKSPLFRWLMNFGGFKERLLADDLFLAKVLMECGVGVFTKTAAEYQKRKENFVKELDFVIADVVMAIVADFMLVWLPAPTVSLRSSVAVGGGAIAKFFHGCPDNAFQVALAGRSYSLMQRIGAIARNGSKLFVVGTASSLIGTGVTNALIKARKAVEKENAHEVEDLPIISTSVGYGVYMAVSSNLRYQILAGVIEQRMLEPLLHNNKALLSAMCFAVRTGNTFLGSLLWVDYARWVGIQ